MLIEWSSILTTYLYSGKILDLIQQLALNYLQFLKIKQKYVKSTVQGRVAQIEGHEPRHLLCLPSKAWLVAVSECIRMEYISVILGLETRT